MCTQDEKLLTKLHIEESIEEVVNTWELKEETKEKIMEALEEGIDKATVVIMENEPLTD